MKTRMFIGDARLRLYEPQENDRCKCGEIPLIVVEDRPLCSEHASKSITMLTEALMDAMMMRRQ